MSYNFVQLWLNKFMTTPWDGNTVEAGQTITLYTISNVQWFVDTVNNNYWELESDVNFEDFELMRED